MTINIENDFGRYYDVDEEYLVDSIGLRVVRCVRAQGAFSDHGEPKQPEKRRRININKKADSVHAVGSGGVFASRLFLPPLASS